MGTYVIKLPDVGEGVAEAEIVEWHVAPGDQVREDTVLAAVMTDKATVEIPSPVDGTVTALAAEIGTMLAVGAELVRLEVVGEGNLNADDDAAPAPSATSQPVPPPQPAPPSSPDGEQKAAREQAPSAPAAAAPAPQPKKAPQKSAPAPAPRPGGSGGLPRPEGEKPLASPAVRRRAHDMGVDLVYVPGSGPAGRITHEDLDAYAHGRAAPRTRSGGLAINPDVEDIKVIGLRRRIAEKMQLAKSRIPHISYIEEVDVTEVEALRRQLNDNRREDQPKLTFLPFLMRAMVKAFADFPLMSAHFDDEAGIIRRFGAAHIGIATQTPAGLVVPVVHHAEARDIWGCAEEVLRLADAARNGTASRDELSGSSITITSLGALGGLATTPVINHPEVAIIGVNKMRMQPVYQDGAFVPRNIMHLSSSFDHRVIDGWDAASFIQRVKGLLEHPATIFVE